MYIPSKGLSLLMSCSGRNFDCNHWLDAKSEGFGLNQFSEGSSGIGGGFLLFGTFRQSLVFLPLWKIEMIFSNFKIEIEKITHKFLDKFEIENRNIFQWRRNSRFLFPEGVLLLCFFRFFSFTFGFGISLSISPTKRKFSYYRHTCLTREGHVHRLRSIIENKPREIYI